MKNTVEDNKTYKYKKTVSVECDVCKETYAGDRWGSQDGHEISETIISKESGYNYPEGGSSEMVEFDICPKCFDKTIVPFFEALGAHPTVYEKDY